MDATSRFSNGSCFYSRCSWSYWGGFARIRLVASRAKFSPRGARRSSDLLSSDRCEKGEWVTSCWLTRASSEARSFSSAWCFRKVTPQNTQERKATFTAPGRETAHGAAESGREREPERDAKPRGRGPSVSLDVLLMFLVLVEGM